MSNAECEPYCTAKVQGIEKLCTTQVNQVRGINADLETAAIQLQEECENLRNENQRLQTIIVRQKNDSEQLQKGEQGRNQELQRYVAELQTAQATNKQLTEALQHTSSRSGTLEKYESEQTTNDTTKRMNVNLIQQNNELNTMLQQKIQELADYRHTLQSQTETLRGQTKTIDQLKQTITDLLEQQEPYAAAERQQPTAIGRRAEDMRPIATARRGRHAQAMSSDDDDEEWNAMDNTPLGESFMTEQQLRSTPTDCSTEIDGLKRHIHDLQESVDLYMKFKATWIAEIERLHTEKDAYEKHWFEEKTNLLNKINALYAEISALHENFGPGSNKGPDIKTKFVELYTKIAEAKAAAEISYKNKLAAAAAKVSNAAAFVAAEAERRRNEAGKNSTRGGRASYSKKRKTTRKYGRRK